MGWGWRGRTGAMGGTEGAGTHVGRSLAGCEEEFHLLFCAVGGEDLPEGAGENVDGEDDDQEEADDLEEDGAHADGGVVLHLAAGGGVGGVQPLKRSFHGK